MTIQENVIFDNPALSDGQKKRLGKILKHCDISEMVAYFYKKFPDGDFENMTKPQAQKLVTGLDYKIPAPIIRGVVGRYD